MTVAVPECIELESAGGAAALPPKQERRGAERAAGDVCNSKGGANGLRSPARTRQLCARRLKQLDRVASGVLEQDLLAARPADDVVAERQSGGTQPLDLGPDIFDDEVDAGSSLPAAGCGRRASAARPSPPGR
jgi:hypothetical protein